VSCRLPERVAGYLKSAETCVARQAVECIVTTAASSAMSREGSQAGGKGRVSLLARNLPMDMKCATRPAHACQGACTGGLCAI